MGCVNSQGQFDHWFGNIHLSGPCNRSCYFCIGQHMQTLEKLNNLDVWPLQNIDAFMAKCDERGISEINLTGTNTDPLLYKHIKELRAYLENRIPNLRFGLRTNGALALSRLSEMGLFDKISLSVHSFDFYKYRALMGSGYPPVLSEIVESLPQQEFKINIVLGPENIADKDVLRSLGIITSQSSGRITKVNLREPYGQPHLGDPMAAWGFEPIGEVFGMPLYEYAGLQVLYWDVHFVEVESVNLYANGFVSETYPITKGHDPVSGTIIEQHLWNKSGRQFAQWQ